MAAYIIHIFIISTFKERAGDRAQLVRGACTQDWPLELITRSHEEA